MKFHNQKLTAMLTLVLCGLVAFANADDPDKMPAAKSVLKKFADSTGGADKYREIKSVKMNGKLEIPAQGVEGKISMRMIVPDKVLVKLEVPDMMTENDSL